MGVDTLNATFVLGMDIGGSRTRCCLLCTDNSEGYCVIDAGSNPTIVGENRARKMMHGVLGRVLDRAGLSGDSVKTTVVGTAGGARAVKLVREVLGKQGVVDSVSILSDQELAFWAASPQGEGLLVGAGTGSFAIGLSQEGQIVRVGGYGHILGDEGGGYWIGVNALRYALQSEECGELSGRALLHRLLEALGCKSKADLITWMYSDGSQRERIAMLTPLVVELGNANDSLCKKVLSQAVDELVALTLRGLTAIGNTIEPCPIFLHGGVFEHGIKIRKQVEEKLQRIHSSCYIAQPRYPAVIGAIQIALGKLGFEMATETETSLKLVIRQEMKDTRAHL